MEPPVGDRPHARRERLHLAAARDDQPHPPGVARDAAQGEGAQHLGQRARVGAVGARARPGLDGDDAVGGVEDEVHLAAGRFAISSAI